MKNCDVWVCCVTGSRIIS